MQEKKLHHHIYWFLISLSFTILPQSRIFPGKLKARFTAQRMHICHCIPKLEQDLFSPIAIPNNCTICGNSCNAKTMQKKACQFSLMEERQEVKR